MNMTQDEERTQKLIRYFVDESGDGVLFGANGRDLLAVGEVRRYFMLGFVEVADEIHIERTFSELRKSLLLDPLFSSIPSLDPKRGKTAHFFHAKDDHAEVRAKVFEVIRNFDFKFSAIIRDMRIVKIKAEELYQEFEGMAKSYRYNRNNLYDLTVYMLFRQQFHPGNRYHIIFSKRGASDRTAEFTEEIESLSKVSLPNEKSGRVFVSVQNSRHSACLQLADYCLWALQRAYERGEVRFLHSIWDKIEILHDADYGDNDYGLNRTNKSQPPTEEELKARWI